jgi:hypothetical protein
MVTATVMVTAATAAGDEVSTGLVVTELPLAKRTQRMEMVPESKTATRVPATATVSPGTGREFILHWAYQAS